MKAVVFEKHGGPEVLEYTEVPEPKAGPGEVLIEVKATSINHIDIFLRRGMPGIKVPLPKIVGSDAGTWHPQGGPLHIYGSITCRSAVSTLAGVGR